MNIVGALAFVAVVGFLLIGAERVMTRTPRRHLVWEAGWWLYGLWLVANSDDWMRWLGVAIVVLATIITFTLLEPAGVICAFTTHQPVRLITEGMYATTPEGIGLVDINGDPVPVVCGSCGKVLT